MPVSVSIWGPCKRNRLTYEEEWFEQVFNDGLVVGLVNLHAGCWRLGGCLMMLPRLFGGRGALLAGLIAKLRSGHCFTSLPCWTLCRKVWQLGIPPADRGTGNVGSKKPRSSRISASYNQTE